MNQPDSPNSVNSLELSSTRNSPPPAANISVFRIQDAPCVTAFGQTMRVLLSGEVTDNRVAVLQVDIPPHEGPPLHVHHAEDETFLVEQGRFEFFIGGERICADAGDVVYGPRGIPHTFRNLENETGVLLVIAVSAGFELFFRQCAEAFQRNAGMDEIMQIAAAQQLEFLEDSSQCPAPQHNKKPRLMKASQARSVTTPHGTCRTLLSAGDTAGNFALVQLDVASLVGTPLHMHSREDEIWMVQSGSFEYSNGKQRVRAEAGDAVWAPRDKPHMFRSVSAQSGTLLDIILPGEFATYFHDCAEMFAQGQMSDGNIAKLNEEYGIQFLPSI